MHENNKPFVAENTAPNRNALTAEYLKQAQLAAEASAEVARYTHLATTTPRMPVTT